MAVSAAFANLSPIAQGYTGSEASNLPLGAGFKRGSALKHWAGLSEHDHSDPTRSVAASTPTTDAVAVVHPRKTSYETEYSAGFHVTAEVGKKDKMGTPAGPFLRF